MLIIIMSRDLFTLASSEITVLNMCQVGLLYFRLSRRNEILRLIVMMMLWNMVSNLVILSGVAFPMMPIASWGKPRHNN